VKFSVEISPHRRNMSPGGGGGENFKIGL